MMKTKTKTIRNYFRKSTVQIREKRLRILLIISCKIPSKLITQKELARKTHMPITTLNYHITSLREEGLIDDMYNLTELGKCAIQFFKHWDKTLSKKLRAHKIQIAIQINKLPQDFFDLKHKILRPFTNKRYRGLKGELNGSTVMFYSSKKLVIKIPDVYGNTNEEIIGGIESYINQLYEVIKMEFYGIKLGDYEICKFNSMHCAILNSVIAESFLLKKGSCFQSEQICIDGSHGIPELECESINNIFDTMSVLMDFEKVAAALKSKNLLAEDNILLADGSKNMPKMQKKARNEEFRSYLM